MAPKKESRGDDEEDDNKYDFPKPSKLASDDDLVAYLRSLEQPLTDVALRIEEYLGKSTPHAGTKRRAVDDDNNAARAGDASAGNGLGPSGPALASVAALGGPDDEAPMLIKGIYRELARREASLSSHKRCSSVVEGLLRVSTAAQLARFGTAIGPYVPFLAFNRYGSHVLQTLLGLMWEYLSGSRPVEVADAAGVPDGDDSSCGDAAASGTGAGVKSGSSKAGAGSGDADDATTAVVHTVTAGSGAEPDAVRAALRSFVLASLASLQQHLHAAVYHDSATHVIRTLVCLLAGLPPAAAGAAGASTAVGKGGPGGRPSAGGSGGGAGGAGAGGAGGAGPKGAPKSTVDSLTSAATVAAAKAYAKAQGKRGRRALLSTLVRLTHVVVGLGSNGNGQKPAAGAAEGSGSGISLTDTTTPLPAQPVEALGVEELGALACDQHASPTLQLLLAACALAAPATTKVLARRLVNISLHGLREDERDGSTDLDKASSSGSGADGDDGQVKGSKKAKATDGSGSASAGAADATVDAGRTEHMWLDRLVSHTVGSRVIELLLACADAPLLARLQQSFFSGRLAALCADNCANFVVQRLLICCRTVEGTELCLKELLPHVGTLAAPDRLYGRRREGVVLHMIAAAVGCPTKGGAAPAGSSTGVIIPGVPVPAAPPAAASSPSAYGLLQHSACAHGQPVRTELQRELLQTLAAVISVGYERASVTPPAAWTSGGGDDEDGGAGYGGSASAPAGRTSVGGKGSGAGGAADAEAARQAMLSKSFTEVCKGPDAGRFARFWLDVNGGRGAMGAAPAGSQGQGQGQTSAAASGAAGGAGAAGSSSIPLVQVSQTGVRILAHALRLHPSLSRVVCESVMSLQPLELAGLACEPSASRHVIEPMVEGRLGPYGSNSAASAAGMPAGAGPGSSAGPAGQAVTGEWAWVPTKLLHALSGHCAALACSRFGCWTVSKLVSALPDGKRRSVVMAELAAHDRLLASSAQGRSVSKSLRLEHWKSNKAGWEASWARPAAARTAALTGQILGGLGLGLDGGAGDRAAGGVGATARPASAAPAPAPITAGPPSATGAPTLITTITTKAKKSIQLQVAPELLGGFGLADRAVGQIKPSPAAPLAQALKSAGAVVVPSQALAKAGSDAGAAKASGKAKTSAPAPAPAADSSSSGDGSDSDDSADSDDSGAGRGNNNQKKSGASSGNRSGGGLSLFAVRKSTGGQVKGSGDGGTASGASGPSSKKARLS